MDKRCECGCGQPAPIATYSYWRKGWVQGEPKRFIKGHNARGANSPKWSGGRRLTTQGYTEVHLGVGHPLATKRGTQLEHRYVMSQALGRNLESTEVVHHINGDKTDNRLVNLEVMSISEHMKLHHGL